MLYKPECLECSKTPGRRSGTHLCSALGPSGSSFGPSSLAPIGIHNLLLSNLTTAVTLYVRIQWNSNGGRSHWIKFANWSSVQFMCCEQALTAGSGHIALRLKRMSACSRRQHRHNVTARKIYTPCRHRPQQVPDSLLIPINTTKLHNSVPSCKKKVFETFSWHRPIVKLTPTQ